MTPPGRPDKRQPDQLREIVITRDYIRHPEGSVLVEFGDTRVLCNATVEATVPRFLRGRNQGWVTAEYGMLPRSTGTRMHREAALGKQSGRSQEIQRLIGRSLRAAVDLGLLGEHTIKIDCDVLQADGGTRAASVTGGCVALADALGHMVEEGMIEASPLRRLVASVSVGVCGGTAVLDLDYAEDSTAETDMNVVMTEHGRFIELQGTAEDGSFGHDQLERMIELAEAGIARLTAIQKRSLAGPAG